MVKKSRKQIEAKRLRAENAPDRRLIYRPVTAEELEDLANRITYKGSAHHKFHVETYPEWKPPARPRRDKNICDKVRPLFYDEARAIFSDGIKKGWVSEFEEGGVPKYIWGKDKYGVLYRAQTQARHETAYHGFPLSKEEQKEEEKFIPALRETGEAK